MKRKMLSILLVILLVLSVLPGVALADDTSKAAVLSVYTQAGAYGAKTLVKSYTADELAALKETKDEGYGYLFYKGDSWSAAAVKDYVTLTALLADSGLSFGEGDYLSFICSDGPYTKAAPTYEMLSNAKYYYDDRGTVEVPAAIALSWAQGSLKDGSITDITAKTTNTGSLRFVSGISEAEYTAKTAAGSRMPAGVVGITVVTKPAFTLSTQRGLNGKAVPVKSYSLADLSAIAEKNTNGYAYQFFKGEDTMAVVATDYVTLDALLTDAGLSLKAGNSLSFICSDGPYTKANPKYEDLAAAKYYFDGTGADEVPAAIALSWAQGSLSDGTVGDIAKKAANTGNLRFVSGITTDQYKSKTAAGGRMPANLVSVSIVLDGYKDVSGASWFYDAVYYCDDAGLFEGGSDGSFNPEKTMSMAELVTILYRTAGYTTDNSGAYWYSKQLSWALDNGIIAQADFSAASPVSRETFITMFYNTVKVTGKYNTSVTEAMQTALKKATDYSSLNPATLDKLAWAVGWGLIKGTDGNSLTVNPAGSIKRSEVCTMLMRYLSGLTVK